MTITPMLAHGGPLLILMGVATVAGPLFIAGVGAICARKRKLGAWLIFASIAFTILSFVWLVTLGREWL
jgi:hypothetical protein